MLARNAEAPVYSPDGSRIAFVSYRDRNVTEGFGEPVLASELHVRSAAGGRPQRLTRTHDWQEASPSWDPLLMQPGKTAQTTAATAAARRRCSSTLA